ncbi:MAG: phage tail tube protein [Planctomycetota bacterium]
MAKDTKGFGAVLAWGDITLDADGYPDLAAALSASYTPFTKLESYTAPEQDVEETETRTHQSPDQYAEPSQDWKTNGELTAVIRYRKDEYAALLAALAVDKAWKVTYSDGTTDEYWGYLKKCRPTTPTSGPMNVEITVRCKGKPRNTPAA